MSLAVVVPTLNEAPNIAVLVERVAAVVDADTQIVFVDDSTDETPAVVGNVAATSSLRVRLLHRTSAEGGLGGAVVAGIRAVAPDVEWVVVMDADLQHPPELIPALLARGRATAADVVVASRHAPGGSASGLAGAGRRLVSWFSGALTKAMFPIRLRNVSDPMTGFFAVRVAALDVDRLRPRGFKILLEILARSPMTVVEEPFAFGARHAGESKADLRQGLRFVVQLGALRFGRLAPFALVGGCGTVVNLALMAGLLAAGTHYLLAAGVAAVVTILLNFALQESWVFRDLRHEGKAFWVRFAQAVGFNGTETLVRLPFLAAIVEWTPIPPIAAQAITLAVAFLLRFLFLARVVYRPRRVDVRP